MTRRVLIGLSIAGLAVAGYIALAVGLVGAPQCLGGGGGCKTVENSIYSHLLGVPVSWFGIAGYGTILLAAVLDRRWSPAAALFLTAIGVGFSAYLTYLELFVIHAICQWCVASAVIMTGSAVVAARWWLTEDVPPTVGPADSDDLEDDLGTGDGSTGPEAPGPR